MISVLLLIPAFEQVEAPNGSRFAVRKITAFYLLVR